MPFVIHFFAPFTMLSHTKAKSNFPFQHIRKKAALLLFISKVDNRRSANRVSAPERPHNTKVSAASQLVNDDDIVEPIPLVGIDIAGKSLAV
ncbi:hypothetical protein N7534_010992 [Penicillium rubens]|nr:hypothetical protein N7534_010992 [Penicillium rubens]